MPGHMSHFVCKWVAVQGKRLLEAILSTNLCALQQIKFAGKTSSLLLIFDENMVSLPGVHNILKVCTKNENFIDGIEAVVCVQWCTLCTASTIQSSNVNR